MQTVTYLTVYPTGEIAVVREYPVTASESLYTLYGVVAQSWAEALKVVIAGGGFPMTGSLRVTTLEACEAELAMRDAAAAGQTSTIH